MQNQKTNNKNPKSKTNKEKLNNSKEKQSNSDMSKGKLNNSKDQQIKSKSKTDKGKLNNSKDKQIKSKSKTNKGKLNANDSVQYNMRLIVKCNKIKQTAGGLLGLFRKKEDEDHDSQHKPLNEEIQNSYYISNVEIKYPTDFFGNEVDDKELAYVKFGSCNISMNRFIDICKAFKVTAYQIETIPQSYDEINISFKDYLNKKLYPCIQEEPVFSEQHKKEIYDSNCKSLLNKIRSHIYNNINQKLSYEQIYEFKQLFLG